MPTRLPVATVSQPAAQGQPSSPSQGKRKARDAEKSPEEKLEYLLTNAKSGLTKLDIGEIINYSTFLDLSEEAQTRLCALLPPTAFSTYTPTVCPTHPDFAPPHSHSRQPSHLDHTPDDNGMEVDSPPPSDSALLRTPATLDPAVFTSPFFLSAAHTFQDHLFSGWLGKKAEADLAKFLKGARDGTLNAEWKDEVWAREHQPGARPTKRKARGALDLTALAKRGLLREGDVLEYRRTFPAPLSVTVEKDLLIERVNPNTHTLSLLLTRGTQPSLPASLLLNASADAHAGLLAMDDIACPIALERGVLDVDGRVSYADKAALERAAVPAPIPVVSPSSAPAPSSASASAPASAPSRAPVSAVSVMRASDDALKNAVAVRAWKAFVVWRARADGDDDGETGGAEAMALLGLEMPRGGRERVATLFYLRGCCAGGS